MAVKRITQPASEPVTVSDVKEQLSIQTSDTLVDNVITRRITEARELVETMTGRSVITCQWEIVLDKFPEEIELYYPPATSIVSIKYIDTNQVEQTMDSADYVLDSDSTPNWVLPAYGTDWPDTLDTINAVRVRYVSGYASASDVPGPIKEAIMLIVGHWMRYQAAVEAGVNITRIPYAVECLLEPYRMHSFG